MHELKKFVQSTGIYLIGNILSKALQFFILPLYTAYLEPEIYGTYDLHVAYITFLSSILFFDIWGGILRFSYDYEKREDKAKPVTCGLIIFSISTALYTFFVFCLGNVLEIEYIGWLYLYGLTMNLAQVVGYVARAFGKNYIYALGGVCGTLINLFCNIVFIAVLRQGYEFIYISYCCGMLINVVITGSSCRFVKLLKVSCFETKLFKEMLRFSIPLSLNSAAFWFLTSYNKVIVNKNLDAAQNGIYAVAMKFSAMLQLVTQCFQMAWQELTFSKAGKSREEMNVFYTKAVNEYIKFMGIGMLMIIPGIKLIFPIMVDSAYKAAENLVPFVMLGTWFSCISSFLSSILSTLKKNRFVCTTTIVGSVVNIILVHLLIHKIGIYAAVISFAAGFMMVVVRRIVMIKKYITVRLNHKQLVLLGTGFLAVIYAYVQGNGWINFAVLLVVGAITVVCYREIIFEMYRKVRRSLV